MSMRFSFRNGSSLLCALFAMSLGGCQDSTDDIGVAVDLNSNVIHGTIEFTNTNPDILAILHGPDQTPPGIDDGFLYMLVRTNSTNISPPLSNSSDSYVQIPPNTRTSVDYEITNEAGEAGSGIIYAVNVDTYLDDYGVYGQMYFSHEGLSQYFQTPYLDGNNGRVTVNAGETVDLGDTFVMDPGFVGGDIYLAGPPPGPMARACKR
jgi:hypothetical protein